MMDDNVFFQDSVNLTQRLIELHKDNWSIAPYPLERHGYVRRFLAGPVQAHPQAVRAEPEVSTTAATIRIVAAVILDDRGRALVVRKHGAPASSSRAASPNPAKHRCRRWPANWTKNWA
jgi:hypothetical protein